MATKPALHRYADRMRSGEIIVGAEQDNFHFDAYDKDQYDIRKFSLSQRSRNVENTGQIQPVYYIVGRVDLEDVVRKFLEVNDRWAKANYKFTITKMFGNISQDAADAWKNVCHEFNPRTREYLDNGTKDDHKDDTNDCGLCGAEDVDLAAHLRNHCPEK